MARVAEALDGEGLDSLATTARRLSGDMRRAGYQGGTGGASTRQHVRDGLDELARKPMPEAVRNDLLYAAGWMSKAEEVDQLAAAKRHLDRRPSRDIRQR